MLRHFRRAELYRELAADTATVLQQCVSAGAQIVAEDTMPITRLRAIERRVGPTPCADLFFLAFGAEWGRDRTARVVRAFPELSVGWSSIAKEKMLAKEWKAAEDVLDEGLKAVDDPMARVAMLLHKVSLRNIRDDTVGALASWKTLADV